MAEELKEIELRHLWGRANNLHQNFYENWMLPRDIELSVRDVKTFIERLKKKILKSTICSSYGLSLWAFSPWLMLF